MYAATINGVNFSRHFRSINQAIQFIQDSFENVKWVGYNTKSPLVEETKVYAVGIANKNAPIIINKLETSHGKLADRELPEIVKHM